MTFCNCVYKTTFNLGSMMWDPYPAFFPWCTEDATDDNTGNLWVYDPTYPGPGPAENCGAKIVLSAPGLCSDVTTTTTTTEPPQTTTTTSTTTTTPPPTTTTTTSHTTTTTTTQPGHTTTPPHIPPPPPPIQPTPPPTPQAAAACCTGSLVSTTYPPPPVGANGCLRGRYLCVLIAGVPTWMLDSDYQASVGSPPPGGVLTGCSSNLNCTGQLTCSSVECIIELLNGCVIGNPLPPLLNPWCSPSCTQPVAAPIVSTTTTTLPPPLTTTTTTLPPPLTTTTTTLPPVTTTTTLPPPLTTTTTTLPPVTTSTTTTIGIPLGSMMLINGNGDFITDEDGNYLLTE